MGQTNHGIFRAMLKINEQVYFIIDKIFLHQCDYQCDAFSGWKTRKVLYIDLSDIVLWLFYP